jgi:glutaredoxin 3
MQTIPSTRLFQAFQHAQISRSRAASAAPHRRSPAVVRANLFENAINGLTTFINNSPLAEGKKQLAVKQAGDYDAAATRAQIDRYVTDNAVLIFSWTRCPFCVNAKNLLNELGAKYTAVELDIRDDGKAFRAELGQLTNRTSMPNCFIGGTSYGGCNDGPGIMSLHKEGKLVPLLKSVGAL